MEDFDLNVEASDDDGEIEIIKKEWTRLKEFLIDMEDRSKRELGPKTSDLVKEINSELVNYVEKSQGAVSRKIEKKEKMPVHASGRAHIKGEEEKNDTSIESESEERKTEGRVVDDGKLFEVMKKFDNRVVPKLEVYDEEAGLSLVQYLERFEQYCEDNYRGGDYLWISELEQHLTGRTREGLRSIKQADDSYKMVKEKLVMWYEDESEVRKMKARKTFQSIKMRKEESMLMYCNRILSLFKIAYPKKNHQTSKILLDQFRLTIPNDVKQVVDNQILNHKMIDQKITWSKIQKYARIFDVDIGMKKEKEEDDEDVVLINLTESNNFKSEGYRQERRRYENDKEQEEPRRRSEYEKRDQRPTFRPQNQQFATYHEPRYDKCRYCGRLGHKVEECRKRLRTCFKCGKGGHRAETCYTNRNYDSNKKPFQTMSPNNEDRFSTWNRNVDRNPLN